MVQHGRTTGHGRTVSGTAVDGGVWASGAAGWQLMQLAGQSGRLRPGKSGRRSQAVTQRVQTAAAGGRWLGLCSMGWSPACSCRLYILLHFLGAIYYSMALLMRWRRATAAASSSGTSASGAAAGPLSAGGGDMGEGRRALGRLRPGWWPWREARRARPPCHSELRSRDKGRGRD